MSDDPEKLQADIAAILERAAKLITPKGKWIKGSYARDANGYSVPPLDPRACRFCMVGAIARAANLDSGAAETLLYRVKLARLLSGRKAAPVEWNDVRGRKQAEVVAKLREAAAKARGEP